MGITATPILITQRNVIEKEEDNFSSINTSIEVIEGSINQCRINEINGDNKNARSIENMTIADGKDNHKVSNN